MRRGEMEELREVKDEPPEESTPTLSRKIPAAEDHERDSVPGFDMEDGELERRVAGPESLRGTDDQLLTGPKKVQRARELIEPPKAGSTASDLPIQRPQHLDPAEPSLGFSKGGQSQKLDKSPAKSEPDAGLDFVCAVCSLVNDPAAVTCAACANVLNLEKLPHHWRCRSESCYHGKYFNTADVGRCGLCGAPRDALRI